VTSPAPRAATSRRTRVAVISSFLPADTGGGAESYALSLAQALSEDHDILILTTSKSPADGLPVARLPSLPVFRHDGSVARKVLWHLADQWRASVHRRTRDILRRWQPDVVHTHTVQGASAGVLTGVASAGRPHVYTAHDLSLLCVRASFTREGQPCSRRCPECLLQRAIRARAVSHIERLLAPSEFVRQIHIQAGIVSEARSHTLRQGAAEGRARLRGEAETLVFGYLGTLAGWKGIPTLLIAARRLPSSAELRIAGSGPLAETVKAVVAPIEYVGRVDGPAKEAFLDSVDVLVIPSEWEENAPLVAAEAACRGIPSVVSDRGGLPETPEAWVFRAGDAGELNRTMASLAQAPEAVRDRSERLLERRSDFSWTTHVERVAAVLDEVGHDAR
jgi:glycosyltransferase involved in cell wall biosynthesis